MENISIVKWPRLSKYLSLCEYEFEKHGPR